MRADLRAACAAATFRGMSRSFRVAILWLLAAEACYAVMRVSARMSASASTLPWAEIAAVRFLAGSLMPFASARMRHVPLRVADLRNAWLRSLFGTGGALSLFYALGTHALSVGDATTLYSTAPLWVALLSGPLLGERVGAVVWLAVVVLIGGTIAGSVCVRKARPSAFFAPVLLQRMNFSHSVYLPSAWVSRGLAICAGTPGPEAMGDALYYLGLLASNSLFFCFVAYALANRSYYGAWDAIHSLSAGIRPALNKSQHQGLVSARRSRCIRTSDAQGECKIPSSPPRFACSAA